MKKIFYLHIKKKLANISEILFLLLFALFLPNSAMASADDDFYVEDIISGGGSDWSKAKDLADEEMGRKPTEITVRVTDPSKAEQAAAIASIRAEEIGQGNSQAGYTVNIVVDNTCSIDTLKKQYMDDTDSKGCWYCFIVSTMTAAYLEAVANVMNVVQTLGLIILRYGFLIWLAYYILQKVSSLAPVAIGKMLQEILMMGFKVLLATIAVRQGIPILTEFFLDPVMLFGIDYGQTMLNGLIDETVGGGVS